MESLPQTQHDTEIQENLQHWQSKPLLHRIYDAFYQELASHVRLDIDGPIVELGSGIANLKTVLPQAIVTDLFPNPWLDRIENIYKLRFESGSISNIILFDVFHHLEFPGSALDECWRALRPGGRVIIFDPAMSALGFVVYGIFHHEPLGWNNPIRWQAPDNFDADNARYYAAQGNATRIFLGNEFQAELSAWRITVKKRIAAISYIASGGYRGPQLYPSFLFKTMVLVDRLCNYAPTFFATRLLVILEKK